MKDKLLASSPTKENIEALINEFFYSIGYHIEPHSTIENRFNVIGSTGLMNGRTYVEKKKGRFYFRRID